MHKHNRAIAEQIADGAVALAPRDQEQARQALARTLVPASSTPVAGPALYQLIADDQIVWQGKALPSQNLVDRVAKAISADGWNGTVLDLWKAGGTFLRCEYPSFED